MEEYEKGFLRSDRKTPANCEDTMLLSSVR
jgi:hypothetical protein